MTHLLVVVVRVSGKMAISKKAMIEARKSRVPLSRVAIQLRRSDNRIRTRVAGIGSGLMLLLICGGSFLMYYRPLEAVSKSLDISATVQLADARVEATPGTNDLSGSSAVREGEIREPEPSVADQGTTVASIDPETPAAPTRINEDITQSVERAAQAEGEDALAARESSAEPKIDTYSSANSEKFAETVMNATPSQQDIAQQKEDAPVIAPASSQSSFAEASASLQAVDARVQLAAAAAPKDIAAILQPREDTTCTTDLKALAEKATVYFPLSSVTVQTADNASLKLLVETMRKCPSVRFDVGGHTDKTGEQLLNLQLSWQRAENTIKHLQSLGADTSRFSPVGFSATRPLYNEQTGLAQAKNRRVEFILR